jgi:hypothetical protein
MKLKHFYYQNKFYISERDLPYDMERKIIDITPEFIEVHPKYRTTHNKIDHIKKYENYITKVRETDEGTVFLLNIHVHHYTRLQFDYYRWLTAVNAILMLPIGSVTHRIPDEVTEQVTEQVTNEPEPEPEPEPVVNQPSVDTKNKNNNHLDLINEIFFSKKTDSPPAVASHRRGAFV